MIYIGSRTQCPNNWEQFYTPKFRLTLALLSIHIAIYTSIGQNVIPSI